MYQLLEDYLASPTNTRISYKRNSSMEFPAVTICTFARVLANAL